MADSDHMRVSGLLFDKINRKIADHWRSHPEGRRSASGYPGLRQRLTPHFVIDF
jgi:hypothetical protein